jgi:hypothetical protein
MACLENLYELSACGIGSSSLLPVADSPPSDDSSYVTRAVFVGCIAVVRCVFDFILAREEEHVLVFGRTCVKEPKEKTVGI